MITPALKTMTQLNIQGFSVRTKNSDEFTEKNAKIPALWQQFYASDLAKHPPVYGIYSNYESDATGFYSLTAGIEQNSGLATISIEAGDYLVFNY